MYSNSVYEEVYSNSVYQEVCKRRCILTVCTRRCILTVCIRRCVLGGVYEERRFVCVSHTSYRIITRTHIIVLAGLGAKT